MTADTQSKRSYGHPAKPFHTKVSTAVTLLAFFPLGMLADTTLCFSPGGSCELQILRELNKAQHSVLVQAYNFTSPRIINGLTTLKKRGIDVRVILDKSWPKTASNAEASLVAADVSVLIDSAHPVAHAKIIVIDNVEVFCGSYNFTNNAATRNSEDLLLITDPPLVAAFTANWHLHAAHSAPP